MNYKFLLVCLVFGMMIFGSFGVVSAAIDVTGFTEIVNYQPEEKITLRTLIVNNDNTALDMTLNDIGTPWGTELFYSNISATGYPYPNAAEAHAYNYDYYRGVIAGLSFQELTINPTDAKEILYTLRINDWVGQCPTGYTELQFPYQMLMTSKDDVFIDTFQSKIYKEDTSEFKLFNPREGKFGALPALQEFRITSSMLPNKYGIFPSKNIIEPKKQTSVEINVYDGAGNEIKNAAVELSGCGIKESKSKYPYNFDLKPTSVGKIRVFANWTKDKVEMHGMNYISVTKQEGLVNWNNVIVTKTLNSDNSATITVNTSSTEDNEYIDKLYLTYSPADRPWAVQPTMEENSDEYEATIENFNEGRAVNYTITGFDTAGVEEEIIKDSYIVGSYVECSSLDGSCCPSDEFCKKEDRLSGSSDCPGKCCNSLSNCYKPTGKPDLIISDIYWEPGDPTIDYKDTVHYRIKVKNNGTDFADSSILALDLNDGNIHEVHAGSLEQGEEADLLMGGDKIGEYQDLHPGTNSLKAIADYDNVVDESDENNNDKIEELVITEPTPTKPTTKLSLSKGWNIISSPINQSLTISKIKETCSIGSYKGYKTWVFDASKQSWTNPSEINPSDGSYIWSNSNCEVKVEGEKQNFTKKELKKDWNLISVGNNSLDDIIGDCKIKGDVWELDKGDWIYPAMNENLDSGKGYWVKVESNCTLKNKASKPPELSK